MVQLAIEGARNSIKNPSGQAASRKLDKSKQEIVTSFAPPPGVKGFSVMGAAKLDTKCQVSDVQVTTHQFAVTHITIYLANCALEAKCPQ